MCFSPQLSRALIQLNYSVYRRGDNPEKGDEFLRGKCLEEILISIQKGQSSSDE